MKGFIILIFKLLQCDISNIRNILYIRKLKNIKEPEFMEIKTPDDLPQNFEIEHREWRRKQSIISDFTPINKARRISSCANSTKY